MARILIAEDDLRIASFLRKGLAANGWQTVHVTDGEQAEQYGSTDDFNLLILDIGLPVRSGLEVLRSLRTRGLRLPVLILTGRARVHDVVDCLDAGADDYMTKPFRFEELLARVRARLRDVGSDEPRVLTAGPVRLDLWTRRVTVHGRDVTLTGREYALLETLIRHAGRVLSREQLLSHAWGYDFDPSTNLVNVYVSTLRKKLGEDVIETLRGFGYRLRTT
ncbi:response regulator transcription factor [Micromonospora sp. NBC_01796]|uniref:response regulator transcription factor n=1 Tax=Micromonospora sp. NBC_01796 TaxID=2975987 RepID=UPI002DDB1B9B|nr:response regulator transcription factor [Micromonospora sp. NBC_01796]WSA88838.1 response regulator transcription factor [Micromonospora sp. NBC_01796]